jgi:hypothetical protein
VFIARAMCGIECMCRRLVLQLQSAEISRTVTSSFVWRWTISVNVNEGIQDPENWTQYSSFVSALFTVYAQWTPVHLTWGLLRVCAACPIPRLNWSSSSVPPGKTSTIRSPPGTAQGYNTRPQILKWSNEQRMRLWIIIWISNELVKVKVWRWRKY